MKKEKEYFVYILECKDKTFYTGICLDLEKRLEEHNGELKGGAKYTEYRRPVKIIHFEKFIGKSSAMKRESEIKRLSKTKKIELVSKK